MEKKHYKNHKYANHIKPFACNTCTYRAPFLRLIENHVRTKSCHRFGGEGFHKIDQKKETLFCPHCKLDFPDDFSLNKHHLTEHKDKPFVCNFCQQQFLDKKDYMNHKYTIHIKPFACNTCTYRAPFLRLIKTHVRKKSCSRFEGEGFHKIEQKKETLFCPHCELDFPDDLSLNKHHLSEHKDKPFVCHFCDKNFLNRQHYMNHKYVIHLKLWACNTCSYRAPERRVIENHVNKKHRDLSEGQGFHKIEMEKEKLSCPHCQQDFQDDLSLNKHHSTEHPDEPFVCNVCKQQFLDKKHYTNHKYANHTTFACNDCSFRTNHLFKIKEHVRKKTCKRYEGEGFTRNNVNKKFPYSCNKCEFKTSQKKAMRKHVLFKHQKRIDDNLMEYDLVKSNYKDVVKDATCVYDTENSEDAVIKDNEAVSKGADMKNCDQEDILPSEQRLSKGKIY